MSFSFPTNLSLEEIQASMADMQVYIDPSQLSKPTYEVVRPCFEQAVIALTGVTREELIQPKFSALDAFEFPELHDESVPTTNFFRHLTRLMMICGVRDFSLTDLFKPDPARLRRALCAIINFAKFREEKLTMHTELEAALANKAAAAEALAQEEERNLSELRRWQSQAASKSQEVGAIQADINAQQAANAALNKQQVALQAEVRQLKQHNNAATDQAAEFRVALSQLQAESEALSQQLVSSPEKHRMQIAELASAADSQRNYYAALAGKSHDLDRKAQILVKFEKELARCIKLQEELEGAVARKKEVSAGVRGERESIAATERRWQELAAEHAALRRVQAGLADKAARTEQQCLLKLDAASSAVDEQLRRREALEAEQAAGDARAKEKEAVIRSWRERTAEVKATAEAQARGVMDKMGMLRKAVSEWNRRLEAVTAQELPPVTASSEPEQDTQRTGPYPAYGSQQQQQQQHQVPLAGGPFSGQDVGNAGGYAYASTLQGTGSGTGMIMNSSMKGQGGAYMMQQQQQAGDTLKIGREAGTGALLARDDLTAGTFTGTGMGVYLGGGSMPNSAIAVRGGGIGQGARPGAGGWA